MTKVIKKKEKKVDFSTLGETLTNACQQEFKFIKTGSTLLNYILGGGWLIGGIAGIFGWEQTGKTLLGLEASYQCQRIGGVAMYDDVAAVLDVPRAKDTFGLKEGSFFKRRSHTVESFFEALLKFTKKCVEANTVGLYVLDDLDTLETTMTYIPESMIEKLDITKEEKLNMRGKLDKAAIMSALLSTVNQRLPDAEVCLMVISQLRDKPGVTFGKTYDVSCGNALKFYCTQRLEIRTIGKIKVGDRIVGINDRAEAVKNKCSSPFQTCEFPVYFKTGIRNVESCVNFLSSHSDLFDLSDENRKVMLKSKKEEPQEEGEDGKKKGRQAFEFDGVLYKSRNSFIEKIEENADLYRKILGYTKECWESKFKVL